MGNINKLEKALRLKNIQLRLEKNDSK